MTRHLFLLGGENDALVPVAEHFVPLASGSAAEIALLMQGGAEWEQFLPPFVESWAQFGATQYEAIAGDVQGQIDVERAVTILKRATGIFISGGITSIYHRLFATEPIRGIIRERYQSGVPVAGISAGSLIMPDVCLLPAGESYTGGLQVVEGMGLIHDLALGVHFTEMNTLPDLLQVMQMTRTRDGLGIDETVCAVFEDEQLTRMLGSGGGIHKVTMTDFEAGTYGVAVSARG